MTLNKLAAIVQRSAALLIVGITHLSNGHFIHPCESSAVSLASRQGSVSSTLRVGDVATHPPTTQAGYPGGTKIREETLLTFTRTDVQVQVQVRATEKITASRQGPKWEPGVAIRIAENKVKDRRDVSTVDIYTDGSGCMSSQTINCIIFRSRSSVTDYFLWVRVW